MTEHSLKYYIIEDNEVIELTTDEEHTLHKVAGNKIYQVYDQAITNIKEAIGPFMPKGIAAQRDILEFCEQYELKPDDEIEFYGEESISYPFYKGKVRIYRTKNDTKTLIETFLRSYFYRSNDRWFPILVQFSRS